MSTWERDEMIRLMKKSEEEHRKKEEELKLERERERMRYERERLEREKLEVQQMKLSMANAQLAFMANVQQQQQQGGLAAPGGVLAAAAALPVGLGAIDPIAQSQQQQPSSGGHRKSSDRALMGSTATKSNSGRDHQSKLTSSARGSTRDDKSRAITDR